MESAKELEKQYPGMLGKSQENIVPKEEYSISGQCLLKAQEI